MGLYADEVIASVGGGADDHGRLAEVLEGFVDYGCVEVGAIHTDEYAAGVGLAAFEEGVAHALAEVVTAL